MAKKKTAAPVVDQDAPESTRTGNAPVRTPAAEPWRPPDAGTRTRDGASAAERAGPLPPVSAELKAIVEALVFASPDPLTMKTLLKLLDSEPKEDVEAALDALKREYEGTRGLQLVEVAGGFQIVTRPELHEWVRRLFHEQTKTKLSVQALETLAVIAYKQPITAPEIAEIRGVNTSAVVNTLLERRLVRISGRKQVVGRPFLYGTTREFLVRFGLKDLSELPKVEDMAEVLGLDSLTLGDVQPATVALPFDDEPAPPEAPSSESSGDDGTDETVH